MLSLPPDLLFGVIVPVITGTITWGFSFPFFARERRYLWLLPLGTFLPFVLAFAQLRAIPSFPPIGADGWLFFIAILALVVGLLPATVYSRHVAKIVCPIALAFLLAGTNGAPLYFNEAFSFSDLLRHVGVMGIAAAFFLWTLLLIGEKGVGRYISFSFLMCLTASILLVLSGSAFIGLLLASLAASLGPGVFLSWFIRRDAVVTPSLMLALGGLIATAVVQGYLYADMPIDSALLFAISPGLAALRNSKGRGLVAALCIYSLCLLLAAVRYFHLRFF